MAYDNAEWHYNGDYPKDLPNENGGTHIGFYITWLIKNDLLSDETKEDFAESILQLKNKEITGRDILFDDFDEILSDSDLNDLGNQFTIFYYDDEKTEKYFEDLQETFTEYDTIYHVENHWDNYDRIEQKIALAFTNWKNKNKIKI